MDAGLHPAPHLAPPSLRGLLARRSASPKRLAAPGPSPDQLEWAIWAALRAPDHGALTPWRVIHISAPQRQALAQQFTQEKQRRDPLASADDLLRAQEHATRAPTLLVFVVCPRTGVTVPLHEQWLAAGAALGNLLNALHALGFGAVMLSGERCGDAELARHLGLQAGEKLAGFISAGTVVSAPPVAPPVARPKRIEAVWSEWAGESHAAARVLAAKG